MTSASTPPPDTAARLLLLLRHGEAELHAASAIDGDRSLTRRGLLEAARAGRLCVTRGWMPQRLLSSPARRACATAGAVARELGLRPDVVELVDSLYLADVDALLELIAGVDPDVRVLMLVGHNPGLTDLYRVLVDESDLPALDTGMLCALWIDAPGWRGLAPGRTLHACCEAPRP